MEIFGCLPLKPTRGLSNSEFILISLARFPGKIAQTWDPDEKVCAIVLLFCNSLRTRVCLAKILDVKHEINFKQPYGKVVCVICFALWEREREEWEQARESGSRGKGEGRAGAENEEGRTGGEGAQGEGRGERRE